MRPVAGLAAALICALLLCPVPPQHPLSGFELLLRAVGYLSIVGAAAALSVFLVQAHRKFWMRAVVAGLWFAPVAVFTIQGSLLAAIPFVILVALATPLFGLTREPPGPSAELLRQFPSSVIAATLVQLALLEALLGHDTAAVILLASGVAIAAWRGTAVDPQAPVARSPVWTALALLLVIAGLLPFRAVQPGTNATVDASLPPGGGRFDGDLADTYRAVVLLPEPQPHVMLIAPLPALTRNPFRENKRDLEIPFYGVYWFFRRPDVRPPKDAVEMRGTPVALTFRSHDSRLLVEEAHQSLGAPFQISCCRAIEVSILNHNREPGTVSIELILVNTFDAAKPSESLGVQPVRSVFYPRDTRPGIAEVLEFPLPASGTLRQFDEFTLRFHRPYLLARESANVGIEGFRLKPR